MKRVVKIFQICLFILLYCYAIISDPYNPDIHSESFLQGYFIFCRNGLPPWIKEVTAAQRWQPSTLTKHMPAQVRGYQRR